MKYARNINVKKEVEHHKKNDDNHNTVEIETLREYITFWKEKLKHLEIIIMNSGTETTKQLEILVKEL